MKYFCKRYLILIIILISLSSCDRKKNNKPVAEREQFEKTNNEEAYGNITYWIRDSVDGMPILVFEPYYFYEDEIIEYTPPPDYEEKE